MNLPFFIAKRYGDISLFSIVYKLGIIIFIAAILLVSNKYFIIGIVLICAIIFFEIKKIIKKGYVHLVSMVSQFGIAVGTAALILILSVFNGFEVLVLNMYNVFDPHLKVTSHEGKNFDQDKCLEIITTQNGINVISSVLEEKVLLEYDTRQYIATIKGVDQNYNRLINFDSILVTGNYISGYSDDQVAVV